MVKENELYHQTKQDMQLHVQNHFNTMCELKHFLLESTYYCSQLIESQVLLSTIVTESDMSLNT